MRFSRRALAFVFTFIATATCLALTTSPALAAIDITKPSAVISFSGYNKTIADLNSLGEAAGQPGMGGGIDMMLKMMVFQGKHEIFDLDRPCGVASYHTAELAPGRPYPFFIFVPVSDIQKFVTMMEGFKWKSEKLGEDHYKLTQTLVDEDDPMFIKQQGKWLYIAPKDLPLEKLTLPDDPTTLLAGLDKKYLFAIRVYGQNEGVKWIEGATGAMLQAPMAGREAARLYVAGKSSEEVREIMKNSPPKVPTLADMGPAGAMFQQSGKEIDTLTLGLLFDKANGKVTDLQLDLAVKAMPGTELDKKIGHCEQLTSSFAGFQDPAAAVTMNLSEQAAPETVEPLKTMIASFKTRALDGLAQHELNEDELSTAKEWIERLVKTAEATVAQGRLDAGLQYKYAPDASVVLLGCKVVNGKECDDVVRQLSQLLAKNEGKEGGLPGKITLDVGSVDSVKLHKIEPIEVPVPTFGEKPELILGISDDAIYLAFGKEPIDALKAAIEKSKSMNTEKLPLVQLSVNVPEVLKLVNGVSPEGSKPIPEPMLMMLAAGMGPTCVTLKTVPIEGGLVERLELPPSLIGTLIQAGQGMMMQQPPMPGAGGGDMPMMPGGEMPE